MAKLIPPELVEKGHVSWKAPKLYLTALGDLIPWVLGLPIRKPSCIGSACLLQFYADLLLFAVTMYCAALMARYYPNVTTDRSIYPGSEGCGWSDPSRRMGDDDESTMIILKFCAIVILTPTCLGPSILVAILGGICGQICMTVRMPVKRVMSNAEAPILGHFGVTLTGLTSIRAFGAQERSSQDSDLVGYIHGYTRTARTFYDLNRWINVRIGILGALFSACLPAYLVYFHNLGAGDTGFSLNMAVAFNIELLWFIRDLMDLEYSATALSAYKTTWKLNKSQRSQGAAFLLPTGPSVVICMSKIFLRVTRATVLTYFATSTFKSNQESALTSLEEPGQGRAR
ncbi:hypothetical protein LshimejAT787_0802360 [Lyophyllum shimeji]|uniref:Uncharacterized protein n=1 Tax=Lyophyllum shimeji TaxID=47721 RepID=A0A9P3PPP9_LYOSH|nr:hypothetical protein LshimejAT787_0802360 [Lyophyllum shimeji]